MSKYKSKLAFELENNIFTITFTNLIVIIWAIYSKWDLTILLFYYFAEIVLIGIWTIIKLIISNNENETNPKHKVLWIFLFIIQYCAFSWFYLYIITNFAGFKLEVLNGKWDSFILSTLILIFSQISNLRRFIKRNKYSKKDSLIRIFLSPYRKKLLAYISLIIVMWFFSSVQSETSVSASNYEIMMEITLLVIIKSSLEILSVVIFNSISNIKTHLTRSS